jgi:hypothetical protein
MAVTAPVNNIYVTGFCGIGSHEGLKIKSPSGALLKTCPVGGRVEMYGYNDRHIGTAECTCECHDMSRQMEDMSGIKFPSRDSVKESSPLSGLGYLRAAGDGTNPDGSGRSVDPDAPSVVVASGARFAVTPTGRSARGQLEEQVRHVVSVQVKAAGEEMIAMLGLTPTMIGLAIDKENPPSSGAIYAVLKRWEGSAMVDLGEKPFRFLRFTDRGKRDLLK